MCQECWGCQKRTIEPNCHDEQRCEHWAKHAQRQREKYRQRRNEIEDARPRAGYQKSREAYTPGTRRKVL